MKLTACGLLASVIAAPALAEQTAAPAALPGLEGRALVSIHDGDMLASAYVNGQLGPQESRDALTVLSLDDLSVAQVLVSNSVAGSPTAVAVTPDGRFALVSESFGPRREGGTTFRDLTPGGALTLVDISDPAAPTVAGSVEVGSRPDGLSISPDGRMVAVALHQSDGRGVAFAPLEGGALGSVSHASLPAIDPSQRISHVEWHPSDDIVALHTVDQATIHFARVTRGEAGVTLAPHGNPVLTSKYPFMGRFTPDGTFYVTSNLYWGPDVAGIWTEAPEGDVTTIRLGSGEGDEVRNHLVGRVGVGRSPEGFAISPDGQWIVTADMEVSYAPADDPRFTPYSALSLIDLNPETGQMERVGVFPFEGILPEAAAFDASGDYLMVVNFDQLDGGPEGGSIDFWRLITGEAPKLVKTRTSVPVPHGPHSMSLVN
ncbi:MAG: hypothetical protein AAFY02_17910 [Pseudomonadota bacterium]